MCPSCPDTPLREYGRRLVCDRCNGILLSVEELAGQIAGELRVLDDGGAARACPRCGRPMRGCRLVVGARDVEQALLRCEHDGIWFGGGSLVEVLEAIGSGGRRQSTRGDGGFGRMYGGRTPPRTLAWRPKRPPPLARSAPVPPSELRELDLRCPDPACKRLPLRFEVSRWCCDDCDGLFVENAALEALVGEMAGGPWQLPPASGVPGSRRCPACEAPLSIEQIEGVTVDRCAAHGVWFDPAELEAALQHAAGIEPSPGPPAGLGSWLRRLFS